MAKRVVLTMTNESIRYGYQKKGGVSAVMRYGEVALEPGVIENGSIKNAPAVQAAMKKIVKQHGWRGRPAMINLADDMVYISPLTIKGALTRDEAVQYVRLHEGLDVDIPFEDYVLAVDVLTVTEHRTDIRFYAYPKDRYDAVVGAVTGAGLKLSAVDLAGLSVYRYYRALKETPPKHVMLVHWNMSGVYITSFDSNRAVFSRHVAYTLPAVLNSENVETSVHAVIADIERLLAFYQADFIAGRSEHIGELVVTGDLPYLPIVRDALADRTGIPVFEFPAADEALHKRRSKHSEAVKPPTGRHGRTTRTSEFELEFMAAALKDPMSKFSDIFGLGLKPAVLPAVRLPKPKRKGRKR